MDSLPLWFLCKMICKEPYAYIPLDTSGWPPVDALQMATEGPDCTILFMAWKVIYNDIK